METKVIALWEKALEAMTDDEVFNLVKAEGLGDLYSSVAGEAEYRGYWDAPGERWRKAAAAAEAAKKVMPSKSHPRRPRKNTPSCQNCKINHCRELDDSRQ